MKNIRLIKKAAPANYALESTRTLDNGVVLRLIHTGETLAVTAAYEQQLAALYDQISSRKPYACCQERSPQLAPRPGRNGGGRPANNAGTPNGAEHHLCSNCHRLTGGHEGSIQYQGGGKGTCSSVCYQTTYKEAAG